MRRRTTLVLPDMELGTMKTSKRICLMSMSWSDNISASAATAVSEAVGEIVVCLLHKKRL